jgi:hypothetical protein
MANRNNVYRGVYVPQCLEYKICMIIERDQDSLRPNSYDTYFLTVRDNNFIFLIYIHGSVHRSMNQ